MNLRQSVMRVRRKRSRHRLLSHNPGRLRRLKRRLQRIVDMVEDQLREQEKQLAADTPFQINGNFDDMDDFDTPKKRKVREASLIETSRKSQLRVETEE